MKGTGRRGAAFGAAQAILCLALITTPPGVAVAQTSSPDNARRAINLCSEYVHADLLTPREAADVAVRRGFVRGPDSTQTEDHMTDYEMVALRSPTVHVHIKVYDYPAGRRSTCTVFAFGLDDAGHRALLTDYVTRDGYGGGGTDWLVWSRTAGSTYVKWERENEWTGSTLAVSTSSQNPETLNFWRVDPQGLPLEAFSEGY